MPWTSELTQSPAANVMPPNFGAGLPPTVPEPAEATSCSRPCVVWGASFKHLKKAAGLSNQGMAKSHAYGVSAVGVGPKTTSAQKRNMATASGVLHKGSSRMLAIECVYGTEAQPEVRNPLLAMRA